MSAPISGPAADTSPQDVPRGRRDAQASQSPRSPRSPQSPQSPTAESRRRMAQPLGLSNNIAPHARKMMPEDIFAQIAAPRPPARMAPGAHHRLHALDAATQAGPSGARAKPGAVPALPHTEHAHRWVQMPSLSPETLTWLRSWLPLRLIPVFSAIPGVVGSLRSAQSMAAFRAQIEERNVIVGRQLLALGPVPEDDTFESQVIRQRQAMLLIEQEGLRAARRTANFHLAGLSLEVVCIVLATLPTLVVSLRLAGQGRIIRAIGVCLRTLLVFNAVMNLVRFAWGLMPLMRDAQRAQEQRPPLVDDTWYAWEQQLRAERSYMARQLAAWTALTLGIVGVSGLIAAPWAAVLGAVLLTIGIATTTAQHTLEGRRFDLPQALWAQPAPPAPYGPCSVFGALAFDPADRVCLDRMLTQQTPHLDELRKQVAQAMRPQLGALVQLMPHVLRFDGLIKPFGWLVRLGLGNNVAGVTAALMSAHLALWHKERELLEGAVAQRRAKLAEIAGSMCMLPATLMGTHPGALECAQAITAAESDLFEREIERLDELERQLCAPRADDPPPLSVMADAWGISRTSPELLGTLIWQLHAQHSAWHTGLVWCVKMAVLADHGDALSDALGSPRYLGSLSPA